MDFRPEIKNMADTVTRLKLWTWFRDEAPPKGHGYMNWGHKNIYKITHGLPDNPHSGATFAFCMRLMQSIAIQGFGNWNHTPEHIKNAEECPICLSKMANPDSIKHLACCHKFHSNCIEKWLINSQQCPLCRHQT